MAIDRGWLALATAMFLLHGAMAQEQAEQIEMRETLAVGQQYRVSCRATLQGMMRLPAEKPGGPTPTLPFAGSSAWANKSKLASCECRRGAW